VDYKNENFEGVTVDLDGNSFKDCTFRDVTFKYAGGDLTMENCGMDRFRFQFDGALANGLFALYQLFGTEALIQIIRGFTDPADSQEDVVLAEKN
jgi:hypothetical protein